MRRPYRTLQDRILRRTVVVGRSLPPPVRRRMRRAVDRARLSTGLTPVRKLRPADLERVSTFDAWQEIADLASALQSNLRAAGIDAARLERGGQVLIAVAAEQRAEAVAALAAAPGTGHWRIVGHDGRARRLDDRRAAGASLTMFRLLAGQEGRYLASHQAGVTLQFWRTVRHRAEARPDGGAHVVGTKVAPCPNTVAAYLTPELWEEATAIPVRQSPHLLELNEPVDLVYTWVDSLDPAWQARLAQAQQRVTSAPGPATDALDPARVRSHDELRYSLRSAAMYASWVRHIWLVTDGQVPEWLASHPKLTVIPHREIFSDPSALPTFNSHAIESQLHHIPGLAEHFIYLNDDVFFGRPVRPELFFHGNGVAKFAPSGVTICADPVEPHMNGAMHAARSNRAFLEETVKKTVTHRMQHTPHAHARSTLADLERRHPDLVAEVSRSRFRSVEDVSIASDLGHYWGYAMGKAVRGSFRFRYIDIGSPNAPEHYANLLATRGADCFCLNDIGGGRPIDSAGMIDFLRTYFPLPSPFERTSS